MKQMTRVQSMPILFIYLVKVGSIKFSSSFNFTERTNLCFSRYDLWMIITCSKADIALCKGIRIPESAKFFLVESGIPLEESGIPLMIGIRNPSSTIHSIKIPTGPTGKSGPFQKVDPFFRNFSSWTKPIHWVLDQKFRKSWLNGSRPKIPESST